MNAASRAMTTHYHEMKTPYKLLSYAVWIGVAWLFWWVGPAAWAPSDPRAAVSLSTGAHGVLMVAAVLVLTTLTAAGATAWLGRLMPDAGLFAAALGLVTLSLHGDTVEYFLLQVADRTDRSRSSLAWSFAAEWMAWLGILVAAWAASSWARRVIVKPDAETSRDSLSVQPRPRLREAGWAVDDVSALRAVLGRSDRPVTSLAKGIQHAGIVAVVMVALIWLMSMEGARRAVSHGQACFLLAASAWVGTYVAQRNVAARTPLWSILASLAVVLGGYVWTGLSGGASPLPDNLPPSAFMRWLPVQGVSASTAGALIGFWTFFDPASIEGATRNDSKPPMKSAPKPPRRKKF